MSSIITADYLRALPEKRKRQDLLQAVDLIIQEYVIPAAEAGNTSVLIKQDSYASKYRLGYPIVQFPDLPDLVEALQARFHNVSITIGSDTTIRQDGVFEKKKHILIDWSIPPEPPAGKGCREMSKCFTHGQRIRHYMPKTGSILYGIYDANQNRIVLESGKAVRGPCGIVNEHYEKHGRKPGHGDGWGECQCEINGKWVSTYSLPG